MERRERITLREADPKDAKALAPLFDAYRRFYGQKPDPRGAEQFLHHRLTNNESVIFVAQGGLALLGFTQLYPTFSSTSLRRLWILNDLFVVPKARRHGVAEALLERAQLLAKDTGAEGLFLETAATNKKAQRLYERMGWAREKDFYRYNYDLSPSRK